MGTSLILIGHGSREPEAREEFYQMVRLLQKGSGCQEVVPAFLELDTPSIPEALARAVGETTHRILVLPLLLFSGRHVQGDIPRLLAEEQARFPGVEILLGPPLGAHPKLIELAVFRIRQAPLPEASSPRQIAVLLVGHGSREPHAAYETAEFAGRVQDCLPGFPVIHCFAELGHPSIAEGFGRCMALGAEAVIVFPCLLFAGSIMARIYHRVQAVERQIPWMRVRMAPHLGAHPLVVPAVRDHLRTCVPVSEVLHG